MSMTRRKASGFFRDKNRRTFSVNATSEGFKRLAILDALLGNRYLTNNSTIFIDEAEANLHPTMIRTFMEILVLLAKAGCQIFLSTHSYFVIKNLYILAQKEKMSIATYSFAEGCATRSDLLEEMPDNPIVQESIDLYMREMAL